MTKPKTDAQIKEAIKIAVNALEKILYAEKPSNDVWEYLSKELSAAQAKVPRDKKWMGGCATTQLFHPKGNDFKKYFESWDFGGDDTFNAAARAGVAEFLRSALHDFHFDITFGNKKHGPHILLEFGYDGHSIGADLTDVLLSHMQDQYEILGDRKLAHVAFRTWAEKMEARIKARESKGKVKS